MPELLYEVDTSDSPAKLANGLATKFKIFAPSFVEFCETLTGANLFASQQAMTLAQRAQRRKKQVKAFDAQGNELKIAEDELLHLPRMTYVRIMRDIDRMPADSKLGKIVREGNGVDKPIAFELAAPIAIKAQSTNADKTTDNMSIVELEFSAKTGMEIEEVLAEPIQASQALMLIRKCAKPIVANSSDIGLLRLPDWAVDQITFGDGIEITMKVLPSFLE